MKPKVSTLQERLGFKTAMIVMEAGMAMANESTEQTAGHEMIQELKREYGLTLPEFLA